MKSFVADVLEDKRNELLKQKQEIEAQVAELNNLINQLRGTRPIADRPQA